MAHAYEAGAAHVPFAVLRGQPAGLASVNPNIRTIGCPFTGEVLTAVPALRPDVAIIHAQKADREGNVLVEGIIGVQKEVILAARRAVVTVEEVVESLRGGHPNACILPHWTVHAVAVVPGGASPSYTHGYYARDNMFYGAWDGISRTRETFAAWLDEHVMRQGPEVFATRAHVRDRRP
jgi:glutaconate CoA-transferase subunit A